MVTRRARALWPRRWLLCFVPCPFILTKICASLSSPQCPGPASNDHRPSIAIWRGTVSTSLAAFSSFLFALPSPRDIASCCQHHRRTTRRIQRFREVARNTTCNRRPQCRNADRVTDMLRMEVRLTGQGSDKQRCWLLHCNETKQSPGLGYLECFWFFFSFRRLGTRGGQQGFLAPRAQVQESHWR